MRPKLADVLEVHCLCLELGYKGRYAFSTGGELRQIIQMCREKILRIRGSRPMFPLMAAPPPVSLPRGDMLSRSLLITAAVLVVATLAAFLGYEASLSNGISHLQGTSLTIL